MTEDVIFENTGPAPDGTRYVGEHEVRRFWEKFLVDSPNAAIEVEEMFVADDRAAVTHKYIWSKSPHGGDPGYVRGATIYRVRDGKISEMYPYVKG
jgi:ketosteroid isomerase-like protein